MAASGEEALALAQHIEFAAVITDVAMVGMSGTTLLHQLSPLQAKARFLVITGAGHVGPEALPRGHGVRVFAKPWDPQVLLATLDARQGDMCGSVLPPSRSASPRPVQVLLVEDAAPDAALFETALRMAAPGQFEVQIAPALKQAQTLLAAARFDVLVVDLGLPDARDIEAIVRLQGVAPDVALVAYSGSAEADFAVKTIRAGAQDYLVKGRTGGPALGRSLRYAMERKRAEMRLSELALRDPLTGLPNRLLFRQRVAQSIAQARRHDAQLGILMLDMDRFKSINDALGHDAGDMFLQEVARRLTRGVSASDTVARLGGDEFAVLVTPIWGARDLKQIGKNILEELSRPLEVSGTVFSPTASIGAAVYPESGHDGDSLLAAADVAMYETKDTGRNGIHIHGAELSRRVERRVHLEHLLRGALARGEFQLHYQPQVSRAQGLIGAEALLRWGNAEVQSAPSEFVGILEEAGLIHEVGPWILRSVCCQLRIWRDAGLDVPRIAINLSEAQLISGTLLADVRACTDAFGLSPSDLELELTEGALLKDTQAVRDQLSSLHGAGYRLALDDFGTGYSSVAYLDHFPIDTLKVDRSFVREVNLQPFRRNLLGGIIQLAKRLQLDVIAEGVETPGELAVLESESCDVVQGFLTGPPLPPDEFAKLCAVEVRSTLWPPSSPLPSPPCRMGAGI